jgi:DNA ligase D-like protein (predicted polymerase)
MKRDGMAKKAATAKAADAGRPSVAGVGISHPDRLIYPDLGISKIQFARYFEDVGSWMLPHVAKRPLTLLHCPDGLAARCNYLRHAKAWGPSVLRRVRIREKTKVGEYLVADSVEALVALAQMGIVEIHTWNATDDDVERPNRIVLDLDPGPRVTWTQVVTAAKLVREVLETLGLESWVKTTGGRGLHVVVPIRPERDWSEGLAFARHVSEAIARIDSGLYTTTVCESGSRRETADRLPAEQPHQYLCMCVFTAGPTGGFRVDAGGMARPARWARALDPADGATAAEAGPNGSVGWLLDEQTASVRDRAEGAAALVIAQGRVARNVNIAVPWKTNKTTNCFPARPRH